MTATPTPTPNPHPLPLLRPRPAPAAPAPARPARRDHGLDLQISALQALCRHVFGFRLAMIAIAAPFALDRARPGLGQWLIGSAIFITFMGSYLLLRDWERFGPFLLRHPLLLAGDTLVAALLLLAATPDSPLAYLTACTPLLAGLAYGRRGAAVFTVLQALILFAILSLDPKLDADAANGLLLPGFYVIAGLGGVTLRRLMLRFGEATRALTETQARLAVTEERGRLARDLHDTVAKTLHGLALAAEGLAAQAEDADPVRVKAHAGLVARSARKAAAESRELLEGLRRADAQTAPPLPDELSARCADFSRRTGTETDCRMPAGAVPPLPPEVSTQLVAVVGEALENVARHARATRAEVAVAVTERELAVSVTDDGVGLPPGSDPETLRRSGHFGVVGMAERAAQAGAGFSIGPGPGGRGTEVRLALPLQTPLEASLEGGGGT